VNVTPPQIPVQPAPLKYPLQNLADALIGPNRTKIVALGSSTTAGEGGIVAYPYRLEAALRDKYKNPTIDVLNRGIGGEEAPKELDRMDRDVTAEKPHLVIWQIGTNSVWQGAADSPPSQQKTIAALRQGIDQLRAAGKVDIVLMDLQFVPALLTPATAKATGAMVRAIEQVARDKKVNLFQRFKLMKAWHELERISFDRMVDPTDEYRLHDSDWATQQLTVALSKVIVDAVDRVWSPQKDMPPKKAAFTSSRPRKH
jgi:lysophospholipase L1-like esterase